ncbi:MAG: cell division protein SepF [Firmicutes bacterium]|nr:cell division protein SepF [Bacillota bacterium]
MGEWSKWLNSEGNKDGFRQNSREPDFYEDTHRNGVYFGTTSKTNFNISKVLPTSSQPTATKQYQNCVIFPPKNPDDVQMLIDYLKRKEPAVINLNDTSEQVAQRILDFVSGAMYALNGSITRIDTNIFLLSPEGIEVTMPYEE